MDARKDRKMLATREVRVDVLGTGPAYSLLVVLLLTVVAVIAHVAAL